MKKLSRVLAMIALVVALILATAMPAGGGSNGERPAPLHTRAATPGPDPMAGPHP